MKTNNKEGMSLKKEGIEEKIEKKRKKRREGLQEKRVK